MHGRTRGGDSRRLALGAAAISALAVALAGCGGGSSSAGTRPQSAQAASGAAAGSSSGKSDPCQVVTVAEASHLVGRKLKKVSDAKLTCTYTARGSLVSVSVRRLPARSKAENYYQQAVREFSNVQGVTVTHPGVGDKSVAGSISLSSDKLSVIVFLKGATYVAIQVNPDPGAAAMKSVAMTALRRV